VIAIFVVTALLLAMPRQVTYLRQKKFYNFYKLATPVLFVAPLFPPGIFAGK